jgi:hypothetical protein
MSRQGKSTTTPTPDIIQRLWSQTKQLPRYVSRRDAAELLGLSDQMLTYYMKQTGITTKRPKIGGNERFLTRQDAAYLLWLNTVRFDELIPDDIKHLDEAV